MFRRRFLALGLALVALGAALPAHAAGELQGRKVALDPGHGETATEVGTSNTVNGTMIRERDVNWDVVVSTKAKLEAMGAQVLVTRAQDEYVDRPTRYARANAFGAEVLISVHHNGSSDHTVNYTTSYYTQKSDEGIARLAQQQLVNALGFLDGGIRRDGFGMTVRPKMPSTLTEAWFLTNDTLAARWLNDKASLLDPESAALANAAKEFLTTGGTRRR